MNTFVFVMLALTAFVAMVDSGGFKILGGFMKEYNKSGEDYYGKTYKWGQTETDANSKELEIESMYCWSMIKTKGGFCKHILIVSTKDDPNEEHYQLVGSNLRIYKDGVLLNSKDLYGTTSTTPPIEEHHVGNGDTWCQKKGDFRYGELYFYVNKTTRPSASDDYSTLNYKQGHPDEHKDEVFVETHADTSVKVLYSDFKRYAEPWGTKGYSENYMWMAPTTLKDAIPLSDQSQFKDISYNTRKQVVLRNEGSDVTSPDMPSLGTTEEVSFTNEGRFMSSFDFKYSMEETVSFSVFSVDTSLGMSQSFAYHTEEEMTQSQSYTLTQNVTWPDQCEAGFQLTYSMEETTEEQELPVQLIFERDGEEWTEVQWMEVSLQKIVLKKEDCCIYEDAYPTCGSETLEMCENSYRKDVNCYEYPIPHYLDTD